ncbi:MAG: lysophospholipid acyltransferase family protein [Polyangiales bacterium]
MSHAPRSLMTIAGLTLGASLPILLQQAQGGVTRDQVDARIDAWSRGMLAAIGMRVRVRGAEHLRGWRAALVMSNHQSHFDVPVLFQVIPPSLRMVAKAELARVPIWGAAMRAGGIVFIDRSDRARAIASLEQAKRQLAEGVSVWIAPEGTRSLDGSLGTFKKGGFVIAEEVGADIVPVTISGTRLALPAHARVPRLGVEVVVTVHPRIAASDLPDRDARMSAVRSSIRSALT